MHVPPVSFHASPRRPSLVLPRGACDAHVHVFGPQARFPFAANRSFTPCEAPKERLFALHEHLGIDRCVVVQSNAHGYDNAATEDAIAARRGAYVGIALLPIDVADAELRRLDAAGFRGARFHFMGHLGPATPVDAVVRFASRLADLGWHLQVHLRSALIGELAPALQRSPVPVVIDHMGRIDASRGLDQPDFRALRKLVAHGSVWVKVSGCDRASKTGPSVRRCRAVRAHARRRRRRSRALGHRLAAPEPYACRTTGRSSTSSPRSRRRMRSGRHCSSTTRSDSTGSVDLVTKRFEGRVAIVTGAGCVGPGWGNGRAVAVRLAEEGARVVAVDRDVARVEETLERAGELSASMRVAQCDVTDAASIAAMVQDAVAAFGRIDVLVNNVGGSAAGGPVEMSEEVFDAQVDFNLKSVFLTLKHVLPVMERQKAGAIVNVASTSGLRWTGAAQVAYAATKAGVIQLSRVVAVQYASRGIRVNCVVPGQLHTPMVEARLAKQRAGGDVEALLKQRLSRIPLGFMGDGRDTAAAVAYLASDEARFVTGAEIVVDGGMTVRCD